MYRLTLSHIVGLPEVKYVMIGSLCYLLVTYLNFVFYPYGPNFTHRTRDEMRRERTKVFSLSIT